MQFNQRPTFQTMARLALAAMIAVTLLGGLTQPVSASAYGDIVISEVMYDSASAGEENDEWVELYNPTAAAIDISGWVLTDDNTYPAVDEGSCTIPAATTIPAGGFLVISRAAILVITTEVVCTASGAYQLENTGDNLALFNTSNEMVFGSLEFFYPDIATTNAGNSIGLLNPTAGWAPNTTNPTVSYWAQETTLGTSPFVRHTGGAANDGWSGVITTPHTISALDGTVNSPSEWQPGEVLGSADTANFFLTWDATDIYVGFVGGNATSDKYNVLVDIDPLDTGSQNSGNTLEYCGATFGADGKPDYALQLYPGGVAKNAASGSSWDAWGATTTTGVSNGAASGQAEFRLNKAELGIASDAPVGLYIYACNNANRVWATWPPENKIDTSNPVEQTTRIILESTLSTRSPRDDASHLGYETQSIPTGTTVGTIFIYFDNGGALLQNWHAHLNVQAAPSTAGCAVTIKVQGNQQVSRLDGGARRAYTIEPNANCSGLSATISLKYEDGWDNNQAQTQTDINFIPSELRGLNENSLVLYRSNGAAWQAIGSNRSTSHNRVVTAAATSQFSTWTFGYTGHEPTAVALRNFAAQPVGVSLGLAAAVFGFVAAGGWLISRRRVQ